MPGVGVARLPDQGIWHRRGQTAGYPPRKGRDLPGARWSTASRTNRSPASASGTGSTLAIEGKSGKDGTVTIPDMMPGRFAFQVEAPGYARWWSQQAATEWSRFQILKDAWRLAAQFRPTSTST